MANARFPVLSGASEVLPTADAILMTGDMSASQAQNCHVYMEFFSDAAGTIPVTPTAGTIAAQGSPMGSNWLAPSSGSSINATDVATPLSAYSPPVFTGRMTKGRVTFAGITGAAFARITFWRF